MKTLQELFGTRIGNALVRNGIETVKELQDYAEAYPFYENTKWERWRRIGPASYSKIEKFLKDN